jgi:hypothetical protein
MNIPGNTIGDYQIVQELGRGAMTAVYLAHQPSRNRYVAIKVLSPELGSDQEFVRRFQHEPPCTIPTSPLSTTSATRPAPVRPAASTTSSWSI